MIPADVLRQIQQYVVRPLAVRIANTVVRGVVRMVDDSTKMQLLQLGALLGETIDGAEHFQSYGFSSVPLEGAEHVTLFPGGDRSHPLTLAVSDRRYKPTGRKPGDVTMYHYKGARITMTAEGDIEAQPAPGRTVKLGASASQGLIRGNQRNTAEQAFLDALNIFVGAIIPATGAPAEAKTVFQGAITTFKSAIASAISSMAKVE